VKRAIPALITSALFVALLSWAPRAAAHPAYYDSNCSSCHGTTQTCAGCHAHGTHADSSKSTINLTGTTDNVSYVEGTSVSVTIAGGYRSGWVRAILYDDKGVELARSTGPSGTGGGASLPVTLIGQAPPYDAAGGTIGNSHRWKVAWYGNAYDISGAAFTTSTSTWTADTANTRNTNHGWQSVSTNAFSVAPGTVSAPKIVLNPTALSFGTVNVGATGTQSSTISNSGNANLSITSIALCAGTSAEYAFSPTVFPVTVAPGGTTTLTVNYTPVDATTDSGCVAVTSNDATSPTVNVSVTGTGVQPSSGVLDIDIVKLTVPRKVTLSRLKAPIALSATIVNAGTIDQTAPATLVGVQNGVTVYSQSVNVYAAPGTQATFSFPGFMPTVTGTISWTLDIADQDPDVDHATGTTTVQ